MTLFRDHISSKLTTLDVDLDRSIRDSSPGMAHLARSGPNGMTCRSCIFWSHEPGAYYASSNKIHGGGIKPAPCHKFKQLNNGVAGPKVPHDAPACKYFELDKDAPSRFSR